MDAALATRLSSVAVSGVSRVFPGPMTKPLEVVAALPSPLFSLKYTLAVSELF